MPLNKEQPHQLTPEEISLLGPGFLTLTQDYVEQARSQAAESTFARSKLIQASFFSGPFSEFKDSTGPALFVQLPAEAAPEVPNFLASQPLAMCCPSDDYRAYSSCLHFSGGSQDLVVPAEAHGMFEALKYAVKHDCLLMVVQAGDKVWAHLLSEKSGIDDEFCAYTWDSIEYTQRQRRNTTGSRYVGHIYPVLSGPSTAGPDKGRMQWMVNPEYMPYT